ncbi:hypothetical protein ACFQ05_26645 [Amycolatopsis umgeniensis]|uniref:Uncharacterized protein n=1 Tax=Amycolatopsis umgeniensis TaxID=336628 RepID=A0A841BC98_9PSEU|nr:hypothetical protein [Amycolatopsis umgeniensis]MBB5856463.1 hypothetical protein [Amycolatopsis umgeniensis]
MRPTIVVLGSGDRGRIYEPPLKDRAMIVSASRTIGYELAVAGCDLVVFSSDAAYVEKDVVEGYLAATVGDGRVIVRAPHGVAVGFDTSPEAAERIQVEPDPAGDWETSYYRSVFGADGIIVIGGGRSTRIAGVIAVAVRIPIVAVAAFGAGASIVWQHLCRHMNDATADDLHLMGRSWTDASANRLVASLLAQRARRQAAQEAEQKARRRDTIRRAGSSLAGATALSLAAASILLAYMTTGIGAALACLLVGPILGAIGGALVRDTAEAYSSLLWSAARGIGAGVLATTLYVASQLLTNEDTLTAESARRLLWFVVPMGIAAGYTFDLVYAKLRRVDVLPNESLQPTSTDAAGPPVAD